MRRLRIDGQENMGSESVRFNGLRAFMDRLLDDIALTMAADRFSADATFRVICQTHHRLDHTMQRHGLEPRHLKSESRHLLSWFRYFADREAFDLYTFAVQRARRLWAELPLDRRGWKLPLLVHYRPCNQLYRSRRVPEGMRIVLATPMITFDNQTLYRLGQMMLGKDRHANIMTAMLDEKYQTLSLELEAIAGIEEHTRGITYDLAESFERVNREYFNQQLARPRLAWTGILSGRTFGHYDFVRNQVWISSSLDRPEIPTFVVDHVMHHELLHKKHGFRWKGRRQLTHTPEFRAEEKMFKGYREAAHFLDNFSASRRQTPV